MTTTEIKAELNRVKAAERTYCRVRDEAEAYSQMLKVKMIKYDYCPHCGARMDGDADANGNDNKTPET